MFFDGLSRSVVAAGVLFSPTVLPGCAGADDAAAEGETCASGFRAQVPKPVAVLRGGTATRPTGSGK